jgi:hypothetical protein
MATEKSMGSPKSGQGIEGDWSVNDPYGRGEPSDDDRLLSARELFVADWVTVVGETPFVR